MYLKLRTEFHETRFRIKLQMTFKKITNQVKDSNEWQPYPIPHESLGE